MFFPPRLHAGHVPLPGGGLVSRRSGKRRARFARPRQRPPSLLSPRRMWGPRRNVRPLTGPSRSGPRARRRRRPSTHKRRDSGREGTMRACGNDVLGTIQCGFLTAGLLAVTVGLASAQMVFDGNLLWQNTPPCGNNLPCQFQGTPPSPAAGCAAGTSAVTLGTVTYTHNVLGDPLLPPGCDWQPSAGSPAYGHALTVPADGFFEQTCFTGAVGPNPGDRWYDNWITCD